MIIILLMITQCFLCSMLNRLIFFSLSSSWKIMSKFSDFPSSLKRCCHYLLKAINITTLNIIVPTWYFNCLISVDIWWGMHLHYQALSCHLGTSKWSVVTVNFLPKSHSITVVTFNLKNNGFSEFLYFPKLGRKIIVALVN